MLKNREAHKSTLKQIYEPTKSIFFYQAHGLVLLKRLIIVMRNGINWERNKGLMFLEVLAYVRYYRRGS